MQTDVPPAVTHRDDTAALAAGEDLVGLDVEPNGAVLTQSDIEDVDALDTEEFIGPGAPVRARTTRGVAHSRPSGMVAWSLPIQARKQTDKKSLH